MYVDVPRVESEGYAIGITVVVVGKQDRSLGQARVIGGKSIAGGGVGSKTGSGL